jgi:hypothetical protein
MTIAVQTAIIRHSESNTSAGFNMVDKTIENAPTSNFWMLETYIPDVAKLGKQAERYFADDPNICMRQIGQFCKTLAQSIAAKVGLSVNRSVKQFDLLNNLNSHGVLPREVLRQFHDIRLLRNRAEYERDVTAGDALKSLEMSLELAVWYHRRFTDASFKCGPFILPSLLPDRLASVAEELARLKVDLEIVKKGHAESSLTKITPPEADELFADLEKLLQSYCDGFIKTYSPLAAQFVTMQCSTSNRQMSSDEFLNFVAVQQEDTVLQGPSGCGKSLLAVHSAIRCLHNGGLPVIIEAKEFAGSFSDILQREVPLCGATSVADLFKAAAMLDRRIMVIVDGYNECAIQYRASLTREIAAIGWLTNASTLVTSQIPLERADLIPMTQVLLAPPTPEMKLEIARIAASHQLSKDGELLAMAVTSGLEARIVGEIGTADKSTSGRYALFDRFARKQFGDKSRKCISALATIAGHLSENISFSLSVREWDRISESNQISTETEKTLRDSGFLVQRGERISFRHELFLHAFAAEAIHRRAAGRTDILVEALSNPKHHSQRQFILGTIEQSTLLDQVLTRITDTDLLGSCATGACGNEARDWANRKLIDLLTRVRLEATSFRFKIIGDPGAESIEFEQEGLVEWTGADVAFMQAVPIILLLGVDLSAFLPVISIADKRLEEEWQRLRPEAKKRGMKALRDPMYSALYAGFSSFPHCPAIGTICRGLSYGSFSNLYSHDIRELPNPSELSQGQLYVLLCWLQKVGCEANQLAEFVTESINANWKTAPYHLRVELLQLANYCRRADSVRINKLVAAVQSTLDNTNIILSTAGIEALQALGALEEDEKLYVPQAREELEAVLAADDNEINFAIALGIYNSIIDHPYSGAYYQVIEELDHQSRQNFLIKAAKGAQKQRSTFGLVTLLIDLATSNHPDASSVISFWAEALPKKFGFAQEGIGAFFAAHVLLGKSGSPLPSKDVAFGDPAGEALSACADLLYWLNRCDLDENDRIRASKTSLELLSQYQLGAAANAVMESECNFELGHLEFRQQIVRTISQTFPDEVADICREALQRPANQISYLHTMPGDQKRTLEFAIRTIGRYGIPRDLVLLRDIYAKDPQLGPLAIEMIKNLEMRLSGTAG